MENDTRQDEKTVQEKQSPQLMMNTQQNISDDRNIERMQEQNLQIQDVKWSYEDMNILSSGIDKLIDLQNHLNDLQIYKANVKQLEAEDEDLERIIVVKERTIGEEVESVIKKRKAEVSSTFDSQLDNTKADVKKVRSRREKKKNKKVSERIMDETADLRRENAQLLEDSKHIMKTGEIPKILQLRLFHALYYPKGLADIGIDLLVVAIAFFLLPTIVYRFVFHTKNAIAIGFIYCIIIVLFGALYITINTLLKNRYHEIYQKVKELRGKMNKNDKEMRRIKKMVQKDQDESNYGLEKFNKEIKELEETMERIASKKKEALEEFETTSKEIISKEIWEKNKPELTNLQQKHEEVHELCKDYSNKVKELEMQLASTYETYLGKEFMNLDKLDKLIKIMDGKEGMVISEALKQYHNQSINM
ncbi:hypothetical protein [Anaerosporobacter faecicola]|uniref:hypothetical protein n=1 Tax=Anaerosporobacter faecicola TaxID=2718714 RepID=UPI00143CB591|nr:hypothetical protein [Anaerosporobacter faecicola]